MENTENQVRRYSKAFKETYLIVNHFAEELYAKIPKKFIKMIKENMDNDYKVTLKDLKQNGEMEETKIILSLIYRDFLCDEKKSKELIQEDKMKIQAQNERYNQIFDNDNVIKTTEVQDTSDTEALMIVENDKWYVKVMNKIKEFFKKWK